MNIAHILHQILSDTSYCYSDLHLDVSRYELNTKRENWNFLKYGRIGKTLSTPCIHCTTIQCDYSCSHFEGDKCTDESGN